MMTKLPGGFLKDERENLIHETAIVERGAVLGSRNHIGPYSVITKFVVMGDDNYLSSHVSLGMEPESTAAWKDKVCLHARIGNKNVFREFTTVNAGYKNNTTIGDHSYMLRGSHVGHCALIGDRVGIHCNVIVGGHARVMHGAYLGLGAVLNPRVLVGPYALIGSQSLCLEKGQYEPFMKYVGAPARMIGSNLEIATSRDPSLTPERVASLVGSYKQAAGLV